MTADADSSASRRRRGPAAGPAATPDDLQPGALVAVPAAAAGNKRPFCLRITDVISTSRATGAVTLHGHVLAANGTTFRGKPLPRTIVTWPQRLTVVQRADPSASRAYLEVQPSRTQIAVMHVPAGIPVRIRCWDHGRGGWADREMHDADHPVIAMAPGDHASIGWHVWSVRYGDLGSILLGHRAADRDVWLEAERRIRAGGVVYVQLEQQAPGRRPAWVATGVTDGPLTPARPPARPELAASGQPVRGPAWRRASRSPVSVPARDAVGP